MRNRVTANVLLLFILFPSIVFSSELSESLYDYFIDGASIRLGVGVRQSGLRVIRKSDKAEGKLVQRNDEAYFLTYSTKPTFSPVNPNFGYSFMFNVSSFDADRQETTVDVFEDLGTRASGQFIYVVPVFFYQWGESRYLGQYTRIGVGVGLGISRFDGDIVLDGPSGLETVSLSNTRTELKAASGLFIESRWNHWGIRVSVAGPTIEDDIYKIQVEDVAVNLGYSFVF